LRTLPHFKYSPAVNNHRVYAIPVCLSVLGFISIIAFMVGAVPMSIKDLLTLLPTVHRSTLGGTVLFEIRLPRVLLSLFVGTSLAVSGAAMQPLFTNPLADD
jgi:iron complex transport system permease protein